MKKLFFILMLAFSGLSFAAQNNYLFFLSSSDAVVTKLQKNNYALSLSNTPSYVSYFSERPNRKAGVLPLADFMSMWSNKAIKDNFAENPPNVAIAIVFANGTQKNVVAEVSNPGFSGNKVTYQLSLLDGAKLDSGKIKQIALFFDDIPWNPGGFGH